MDSMQLFIIGGWLLSLAALTCTVVAVVRVTKGKRATETPISSWVAYDIGIFVTTFFIILSQDLAGVSGAESLTEPLDALFGTFQMFGLNRDISLDAGELEWMGGLLPLYQYYNAALFLAAPTAVIGSVISVVVEAIGVFRLKILSGNKPVYIFSEATDRSFTLAKSLKESEGEGGRDGCAIVFSGMEKDDESKHVVDAKSEGMLCLPQSMSYLAKKVAGGSQQRTFVFSSENEIENISGGVELARDLAKLGQGGDKVPHVLIFSSSPVGGPIVDAVAKEVNKGGKVSVLIQRVDWVRNTVDTMIDEYPLFTTGLVEECIPSAVGDEHRDGGFVPKLAFDYAPERRRVLVVGSGAFAKEFVKCALWATQLGDDITTQIDVVMGADGRLEDEMKLECPEFFADDGRPYQGFFNIAFAAVDPETGAYQDYLLDRDLEPGERRDAPTYVVVALDDDLACAKVALRTREILEQRRFRAGEDLPAPFIAAVINDSELAAGLRFMEKRDRFYAIQPVGSNEDSFDYENVFNPRLMRYAKNINRVYNSYRIHGEGQEFKSSIEGADVEFANSEYNQRSSMAAALHRKYSLYLFCRRTGLAGANDIDWSKELNTIALQDDGRGNLVKGAILKAYEHYLQTESFSWLSKIEHDRWSAYVATEGYEYAGTDEMPRMWPITSRQEHAIAHLHGCLTEFDDLPNLDTAVMEASGKSRDPFQELDDFMLRSLGVIVAVHATEKGDNASGGKFWTIWQEYFPDPAKTEDASE